MKRKLSLIFLVFFIAFSASSCASDNRYKGYKEVYSVDSKYYFYVQPQYAESVSNLGYSNTVIVRYTTDAYALVSTNDYFESLPAEQIGGYSRENFSMGDPALDSTFNDQSYIQEYFETYLGSSHSSTDMAQIKKITVNNHEFWLCHCYYYDVDFDMSSEDPKEALSGEAYIYYTIYDGITYFINVTSVDMYLSSVKDASDFINNFYIGTRMQSGIKFVWTVLAALVILDIIFVMSAFFKIKIEPAVIIERIVTHLRDVFEKGIRYSPDEFNEKLCEVELDRILGRVEIEKDSADELFIQNSRILACLDEILDRNIKEAISGKNASGVDIATQLDYILCRKERPKLFKAPVLPEAPVIDAVDAIHSGVYNEKEDERSFNAAEELDRILGRRDFEKHTVEVSPPEDFKFKLDHLLTKLSEKRSLKRKINAEQKADRLQNKELKAKQRFLERKQASERRSLRVFERKVAALDRKYNNVALKTYVPDLVSKNVSSEDAIFNLDTILGRTLMSKLDNILDRTVWSAPPAYGGTPENELLQRTAAVGNAAVLKQKISDERKRRIAVLPQTQRAFYKAAVADGFGDSISAKTVWQIRSGVFEYKYDDVINENPPQGIADALDIILGRKPNSLSNQAALEVYGPKNYEAYLKIEKLFQEIGAFVSECTHKTIELAKKVSAKLQKIIAKALEKEASENATERKDAFVDGDSEAATSEKETE